MGSRHVPNELKNLHVSCVIYFREEIRQPMGVSHEILFPCGMNFAHLILTLGKQFMGVWIGDHLAYDESLIFDDVTKRGEFLQHSPYQFLEDKQHLGGEDYNIPN